MAFMSLIEYIYHYPYQKLKKIWSRFWENFVFVIF